MRITGGKNPLDATSVHPESYGAAEKLIERLGYTEEDIVKGGLKGIAKKVHNPKKLAEELGIGEITLEDILKELEKPARDPRDEMPKPILRSDVLEMKDLKPGMVLKGTVRNVIDFGVFVDIGVHQDGLVHISMLADSFVKDPRDVVKAGDIVKVKVLEVDIPRQRISLTMRMGDQPGAATGARNSAPASERNRPRQPRADKQGAGSGPQSGGTFANLFANAKNLKKR